MRRRFIGFPLSGGDVSREVGRKGRPDPSIIFDRGVTLSRVEESEREIEKLKPQEVARLRDWILELDWREWDRQIDQDSANGKLDKLFKQSLEDHRARKSKEV